MTSGSLYRLSAFSSGPAGGNPAGVWVGAYYQNPTLCRKSRPQSAFQKRPS